MKTRVVDFLGLARRARSPSLGSSPTASSRARPEHAGATHEERGRQTAGPCGDEPDYTMLSRRWNGVKLITAEIAIELARRVHASEYGADDLAANEPLSVTESGNAWLVSGSKAGPQLTRGQPIDVSRIDDFPFGMKISKFDGQILSYLLVLPSE